MTSLAIPIGGERFSEDITHPHPHIYQGSFSAVQATGKSSCNYVHRPLGASNSILFTNLIHFDLRKMVPRVNVGCDSMGI